MTLRSPIRNVLLAITSLLGLGACQPGEVTVVDPDGSDDGPRLGTLVAQVELREADSALADSLGWTEGVPKARVRILRNGTADWQEAETDDTGTAVFEDLQPGMYFTYVERTLSQSEADRASGVVRGFGGGEILHLGADTAETSYRLRSSRRTGLVISEVSGAAPYTWEVPGDNGGNRFFEVYNQSNTTLHLDGLIFGTWPFLSCDGCANTCTLGEPVRTDSTGVYFSRAIRFPGSGSDYPIEPGQTKLIAASAQDHRELHEDMLDLRDADFEIGGSGFADNPSVPNMEQAGDQPMAFSNLLTTTKLWFLAEPFEPLEQPISWRDFRGAGWRKVPVELVLDVAASKSVWPEFDSEHIECDPMIHPHIDGLPGGFKDITKDPTFNSFQREVLTTEDGIPILMDTNTSASDFSIMRYTPDGLPDGGQ